MFDSVSEYEKIESRLTTVHRCVCIDGNITGRGNCVGYCSFAEHPGFLTEDIRKARNCIGKGCRYYIGKAKRTRTKNKDSVYFAAVECLSQLPWIRVMNVRIVKGVKTVFYVSVSDEYSIPALESGISARAGENIKMEKIDCDYEKAVLLVCEK